MIQKIFHHIWIGNKTYEFPEYRESWIKCHPDYEFKMWDDSNLPKEVLSKETINIIENNQIAPVSKGDSLKFDLVRIFGGVFLDMDMECLKPIDAMFENDEFAAEGIPGHIDTGVFGSIAEGSWINDLSRTINNNILNNMDAACNMYMDKDFFKNFALCGVRSLKDKLILCKKIYPPEIFYPKEGALIDNSYSIHHYSKTQTGRWFRGK
jgi:hypothetical protein